jgi:hypothetical protein
MLLPRRSPLGEAWLFQHFLLISFLPTKLTDTYYQGCKIRVKVYRRKKMSMYKEFVKDFAKRTQDNLYFIENNRPDFKITQLVNSCLGLIAFPRGICFDKIPETPLEELTSEDWPVPNDEGGYPPARNLNELVQRLRNGITHGHVKFFSDENYDIKSILIWDEKGKRKNWQTRWNMDELRKFTIKFSDKLIHGDFCSRCKTCLSDEEWLI